MSNLVPPTSFQNIQVWVKPKEGEVKKYTVITVPTEPEILNEDTVINYQIVDTDGLPIIFSHMTVKPEDNNQLSEETVSLDGKLLTFVDANTEKMVLNITLHFKHNDVEFSHDPQIQNNPE
jgi:hypothetical protein